MSNKLDTNDEGAELSLRDSLTQAFDSAREGAEAAQPPKPAAAGAPAPAADPTPREDGRDDRGRFAPKAPETPNGQPTAPLASASQQPGAQSEAPRAPASWTAAAKAEFAALSPTIQAEIARREREIEQGFAQQQSRLELANRFDAAVAPFKDRLAAAGEDPIQAVQRLVAAQTFLEKNPGEAILWLARSYGVHPARLAQAAGGQQPQAGQPGAPAQLPPQFQTLAQQVQTLQAQLTQRDQAERTQRLQSLQSEIASFAADAAHPYFHNVKDDMAALIQSGRAKDLQDAYDKAVWANPETRALLQAETAKKAEAERLNAQRQSAAGARRAAGSVTGAPAAGASPPGAGTSNRSLREDLTEAFRAHRA